jgi:hypothetical protein
MNIIAFQTFLKSNQLAKQAKYFMNERLNKLSGYTALLKLGLFHTNELSQISKEEAEKLLTLSLVELIEFANECDIDISTILRRYVDQVKGEYNGEQNTEQV